MLQKNNDLESKVFEFEENQNKNKVPINPMNDIDSMALAIKNKQLIEELSAIIIKKDQHINELNNVIKSKEVKEKDEIEETKEIISLTQNFSDSEDSINSDNEDDIYKNDLICDRLDEINKELNNEKLNPVSYTHLTLPTTPYV